MDATMQEVIMDVVNKPYVSPERECHYYVELAKAFLEDDDGPEPSEKLALYYYCIAEDE